MQGFSNVSADLVKRVEWKTISRKMPSNAGKPNLDSRSPGFVYRSGPAETAELRPITINPNGIKTRNGVV